MVQLNMKDLKDKIKIINKEIEKKEQEISSLIINNIFNIRKCEYCGCPDGIHRTNCKFLARIK